MAQVQDINTGKSTGQNPHVQGPTGQFQVVTQPVLATPPHDYRVLSILSCLCCIWPIGAVAICFSHMARDAYYQGNIRSAEKYGYCALGISIVSIIGGIILISVMLAIFISPY